MKYINTTIILPQPLSHRICPTPNSKRSWWSGSASHLIVIVSFSWPQCRWMEPSIAVYPGSDTKNTRFIGLSFFC